LKIEELQIYPPKVHAAQRAEETTGSVVSVEHSLSSRYNKVGRGIKAGLGVSVTVVLSSRKPKCEM
jgi:hypothetical protein